MNNSLNFIKERINSGETDLILTDYESLEQVDLLNWLKEGNNEQVIEWLSYGISTQRGDFSSTIKYDPNCEYDYFTMSQCCCDGTLMFYNELCSKVLNKAIGMETGKKDVMTDEVYTNIKDYTIEYVIGDFVFGHEYDLEKFKTNEKPWIHSRFTVMLPIKFDIKLKQKGV